MMRATLVLLALEWCARPPAAAALTDVRSDQGGDSLDDTLDVDDYPSEDGWQGLRPNARIGPGPWTQRGWANRKDESTVNNTAVYMAASVLSGVKITLIRELARVSPYPIVIGYDKKDKTMSRLTKGVLEMMTEGTGANLTVEPVSLNAMLLRYGSKITNFNGVYEENPAKLAVMDWFASSPYKYVWHLEDDTWARGLDAIASSVASFDDDLIIRNFSTLPFWAQGNSTWRLSDKRMLASGPTGTMVHCNPAAFRMSKRFAQLLLKAIEDSNSTNHHELWFPYIVQQHRLSWRPLPHSENLHFNVHDKTPDRFCVEDVKGNNSVWLAHPVKCNHHFE